MCNPVIFHYMTLSSIYKYPYLVSIEKCRCKCSPFKQFIIGRIMSVNYFSNINSINGRKTTDFLCCDKMAINYHFDSSTFHT